MPDDDGKLAEEKQPDKPAPWSESGDLTFANWKRIRLAIEHENTLANQRFTWLLTTNGFLFAALGGIQLMVQKFGASFPVLMAGGIICLAGMGFSWLYSYGLRAAAFQHEELRVWWSDYLAGTNKTPHPPICGALPMQDSNKKLFKGQKRSFHYHWFPHIFMVLWAALLALGWYAWLHAPLESKIEARCYGAPVHHL